MAKITVTEENKPTPEELRQMLNQAMSESNPVDDLLQVAAELREYEQRYGTSSTEFFKRFHLGELDELQHCIGRASAYDVFLKLKTRFESCVARD